MTYSYFTVLIVINKGADQAAQVRRLVCAFVVRKQQSQGFSRRGHMIWKPRLPGLCLITHMHFAASDLGLQFYMSNKKDARLI